MRSNKKQAPNRGVRCLRSALARASGGKADAMTGDISARRGALPIKINAT